MRKIVAILATLGICQGCAHAPSPKPQPEIVVDFSTMTASSQGWSFPLTDCSDEQFNCVEATGRFLIAFPRNCPTDDWDWNVAGHRFRMTAPAAHYGLPSAGYYSEKYPHVYLLYYERGFEYLWIRTNPVPTDNHGGSSVAEYHLRFPGREDAFACQKG